MLEVTVDDYADHRDAHAHHVMVELLVVATAMHWKKHITAHLRTSTPITAHVHFMGSEACFTLR